MTTSRPAVRIDPVTGVRDEAGYFGTHEPLMFGTTHLPAGEARAGVVICTSVHAELVKAYRKESLLGKALAAAGIAVQRFHYRGAGNSYGTAEDLTLDAMSAAVHEAREQLARKVDVDRVGYLGTRLGAFPATAAAVETPGAPLALWSPVQDAGSFMREVFRSHSIAALRGEEPEPTERMMERLRDEGRIELLGYEVTMPFHASLEARRLRDEAPAGSPVLLFPFGPTNFEDLTTAWTAAGADVEESPDSIPEAWWLTDATTEAEDGHERTTTLVDGTADWFIRNLLADDASAAPRVAGGVHEGGAA